MPRPLRMESESGVYHVINRGNYRADIFSSDGAKNAFVRCLEGACERTGWVVHAWCVMTNHYHLAVSTPRANLVDGMRWLQGTFAARFNRYRNENGHLFQGRYKSLIVEPNAGLGPLCHYIHLNPVRARLCEAGRLRRFRWTSLRWFDQPVRRPNWYDPQPFLRHAGELADTPAGRGAYFAYLEWLAEDEPTQKRQRFESMSRGWTVGTESFTKALAAEHRQVAGHGVRLANEARALREVEWSEYLARELARLGRSPEDLRNEGKSAEWKVQLAAKFKAETTVTNRWLSVYLCLGALHEVSRKVSAWSRRHASPR
jgi:putative transposase